MRAKYAFYCVVRLRKTNQEHGYGTSCGREDAGISLGPYARSSMRDYGSALASQRGENSASAILRRVKSVLTQLFFPELPSTVAAPGPSCAGVEGQK